MASIRLERAVRSGYILKAVIPSADSTYVSIETNDGRFLGVEIEPGSLYLDDNDALRRFAARKIIEQFETLEAFYENHARTEDAINFIVVQHFDGDNYAMMNLSIVYNEFRLAQVGYGRPQGQIQPEAEIIELALPNLIEQIERTYNYIQRLKK